jgi:putative tricarboxylic transport membrane protein
VAAFGCQARCGSKSANDFAGKRVQRLFSSEAIGHAEVVVKTLRSADIVAGIFLAVLGLLTLWAASNIVTTMEHRLSPRALPYAIGILIFGCGIGMAVKAWRSKGAGPVIQWPDAIGIRIIGVTLAAIGLYNAFLNLLGLPIATFLYIAGSIWYLNRTKWITALLTGLACGILSHFVFISLLGLSFPEGIFFKG